MSKKRIDLLNQADMARSLLHTGSITYEEAVRKITPYIDLVNEHGKEVAAKYGVPFKKVSVKGFLR